MKEYKAHPLMIWQLVKPFLFVLIIPLLRGIIQYIMYKQVSGVLPLETFALSVILIIGFMRLKCFKLRVYDGFVEITQGLIFRKTSWIETEKLSSVVTLQNPVDALFNAVTFRINTEAGRLCKPDYEFKLFLRDAEKVSELLYGEESRTAVSFSVKRLALAAALTSSAVTGLIVAVPIIDRIGKLLDIALSEMLLYEINKTANRINTYFPPIFNIITLIVLIGYLISFIYSLIANLRFRLFAGNKKIEIRHGVFVRKRILFRRESVNNICIDQTPLMQFTRRFMMRAAVGGFGGEKGEKAVLVPVGRHFELKNRFSLGFQFFKTDGLILRAERSRRMKWRFYRIPAMLALFTMGIGVVLAMLFPYFDRLIMFLTFILLIVIAYYAGLCRYNYKFGQLRLGENICARGINGINTREMYCPRERIGIVKFTQNPIDRRWNTCKVRLTVRSESADHVKVKHLNYDSVRENLADCFNGE